MPKVFIEDSSNPKNVKSINSNNGLTNSYLVSCRVIPRPATMKWWEKDVSEKYVLLEI